MRLLPLLSLLPLALTQIIPPPVPFWLAPVPYTLQPYIIQDFLESTPSGRSGPPAYGTLSFTFADPNSAYGYVTCSYTWDIFVPATKPENVFWPCSPTNSDIMFRKVVVSPGNWELVAKRSVVHPATSVTYDLVGNGVLYHRGVCGGSGVCSWTWAAVPSLLKVVELADWTGV